MKTLLGTSIVFLYISCVLFLDTCELSLYPQTLLLKIYIIGANVSEPQRPQSPKVSLVNQPVFPDCACARGKGGRERSDKTGQISVFPWNVIASK